MSAGRVTEARRAVQLRLCLPLREPTLAHARAELQRSTASGKQRTSSPDHNEGRARACELSPSATSHNLRILRSLRLVRTRRAGRYALYALHDHHVPELLAAIRHHHEHVNPPPAAEVPASRKREGAR